jgi:hypothetical protein
VASARFPDEVAKVESMLATSREALGDGAFDDAWRQGEADTLEALIALTTGSPWAASARTGRD